MGDRQQLGLEDGDDLGAEGVVVVAAGEEAVVGFLSGVVAAVDLELAEAGGGFSAVRLGPRGLVEVVALDVDFPEARAAGGAADEKAIVRAELADGLEVLDRVDVIRRGGAGGRAVNHGKHLEEEAVGIAGIGCARGVQLAEQGAEGIALRLVAGGGIGSDERGVNFPVPGIELAGFFRVLDGEGTVVQLERSSGSVEIGLRAGGVRGEDMLEIGESLVGLVGVERGEAGAEAGRGRLCAERRGDGGAQHEDENEGGSKGAERSGTTWRARHVGVRCLGLL